LDLDDGEEDASEVDEISMMSPDYTPESLIDMKLI
jgi:hypothetical protein